MGERQDAPTQRRPISTHISQHPSLPLPPHSRTAGCKAVTTTAYQKVQKPATEQAAPTTAVTADAAFTAKNAAALASQV